MKKSLSHIIIVCLGTVILISYSNLEICQAKAGVYAEGSPLACALFFAKRLPEPVDKVEWLLQVATRYVKVGQKKRALKILFMTLQQTEKKAPSAYLRYDPFWKASKLAAIAGGCAKVGQKEKALKILSETLLLIKELEYACDKPYFKSRALAEIAGGYVKTGEYERAFQIAKTIEKPDSEAKALIEIATRYNETGQKEKTLEILSEAFWVARTVQATSSMETQSGVTKLVEIATTYNRIGKEEKALEVLSTALQIAKM